MDYHAEAQHHGMTDQQYSDYLYAHKNCWNPPYYSDNHDGNHSTHDHAHLTNISLDTHTPITSVHLGGPIHIPHHDPFTTHDPNVTLTGLSGIVTSVNTDHPISLSFKN